MPEYWEIIEARREVGERWGVDPDLSTIDFEIAIRHAQARVGGCQVCGFQGDRINAYRCDMCVMRQVVTRIRERDAREQARLVRAERRKATSAFVASLPAGRRRLLERSGVEFSSPRDAFAESHGEW